MTATAKRLLENAPEPAGRKGQGKTMSDIQTPMLSLYDELKARGVNLD